MDALQLRPHIEACARSPWFLALPGPVRVRIIDCEAEGAARKMYWSKLAQDAWQQDWEKVRICVPSVWLCTGRGLAAQAGELFNPSNHLTANE